eukprot:CAMPEP_0198288292 /NCGR_PEP_ID=MMETSP1449-20131203/6839_1 /TAXON_ID=420275 /ORGANISM="Attheya septentrionalis, Strain CCMP2084" /LENGTH=600 /DNA_ID=CAMNT_0043986405 /DNA_START=279 /DNA_END=2081 /DNA_ORIENTATION=+
MSPNGIDQTEATGRIRKKNGQQNVESETNVDAASNEPLWDARASTTLVPSDFFVEASDDRLDSQPSTEMLQRWGIGAPSSKATTDDTSYDKTSNGTEDFDRNGQVIGDYLIEDASLSRTNRTSSTTQDRSAQDDVFVENEGDLPPGVTLADRHDDAMMRLLAGQLRRDWVNEETSMPALERRLKDFEFAQKKRRDKYGNERPWGIIGLYDHLAAMRMDLEWSEDAAWRRDHGKPYLSWTDFESTKGDGYNRPFFTYAFLFICTIMMFVSLGANGWKVEPLKENPMIGPSAQTLIELGAKQTFLIVNEGEWYRIFTPMFLHAGLIHYFLNMMALWFIGGAVEKSHGSAATAIITIIPAVGGNILSAIFLPEYISVGASGGIFGLIGACIADIIMNWSLLFSKQVHAKDADTRTSNIKVVIWLVVDIFVNCMVGLTPFVDNFTHLGGMLYGLLCGFSTLERMPLNFFGVNQDYMAQTRNLCIRFGGLIMCALLILLTTLLLAASDGYTTPCSGCRYASCAPFPPFAAEDKKWWYCDDCHQISALPNLNIQTGFYDSLSLTCPDGDVVEIDLLGRQISKEKDIQKKMTGFCRSNCDDVFKRAS